LKTLVITIEQNPDLLPTILPRLISGHGLYNFDRVTKTKTIERLMGTVDKKNVEEAINALIEPVKVLQELV